MERLAAGIVKYAGKVWVAGRSRKSGACWKTGKPFGKGELVYRPLSNGYDRMNRIVASYFDPATPHASSPSGGDASACAPATDENQILPKDTES